MQYTLDDFDYRCPPNLIAQYPTQQRDESRLMVVDDSAIHHRTFRDLPDLVQPGDLIVLNTSRVIRARLKGVRQNGASAEVLLVHPEPDGTWQAMVHPGGKLKEGRTVSFGDHSLLTVVGVLGGGLRRVALSGDLDWNDLMQQFGDVPLPPYITRPADPTDEDRYQTVYAEADGSVAAPTAGLHFTRDVLSRIEQAGAQIVETVLHVGPGTFKPVQVDDPSRHTMHAEWFSLSSATAEAINRTRANDGRVWAVGTTVARVLETVGRAGPVAEQSGWTDIFIYPPFEFRVVDCLLTNFHLPRSTLLMLVCAFGGYQRIMDAYRTAAEAGYRFYSYGDAMVIL